MAATQYQKNVRPSEAPENGGTSAMEFAPHPKVKVTTPTPMVNMAIAGCMIPLLNPTAS
jgi:hypothetical protein